MPANNLAGNRYPISFTNLILIEEGTLALQKHYVNLNHYDTNIIHLLLVLISSALTTATTVTKVAAHFFLVSLISLVLVGGHDGLQLLLILLLGLLAILTGLFHLGSHLLGHLRTLTLLGTLSVATAEVWTWTHSTALTATAATTHTHAGTHCVGILGVQFEQLCCLVGVKSVFLYCVVRTLLNHLCTVKLLVSITLRSVITLSHCGCYRHHGYDSQNHFLHFTLILKVILSVGSFAVCCSSAPGRFACNELLI